jgi:hypothetical protein
VNPSHHPHKVQSRKQSVLAWHWPTLISQKKTQPPPSPSSHVNPTQVQGWDMENVLLNLDPVQMKLWNKELDPKILVPGSLITGLVKLTLQMKLWNEELDPKILVYTWEPNYWPGQIDTASTLCKAIASVISITEPPPQAVHQWRFCPSPLLLPCGECQPWRRATESCQQQRLRRGLLGVMFFFCVLRKALVSDTDSP